MTRADELRQALERARDRVLYADRELARFLSSMQIGPEAARLNRKLSADLQRARADVEILERELGRELERRMPA
jgi:hypothetical protein